MNRPDLGQLRLRAGAVAHIRTQRRCAVLVAQVLGQLRLEGGLQHLLGQPGQQPARADQGHPLSLRLGEQLLGELLLINDLSRHRIDHLGHLGRDSHGHLLSDQAGPLHTVIQTVPDRRLAAGKALLQVIESAARSGVRNRALAAVRVALVQLQDARDHVLGQHCEREQVGHFLACAADDVELRPKRLRICALQDQGGRFERLTGGWRHTRAVGTALESARRRRRIHGRDALPRRRSRAIHRRDSR